MRLLLVEDYRSLREALVASLKADGYAVDAAVDGDEGWWLLKDSPYDAVILDRMLPGIDGLELLRRHRSAGGDTPVLLLTAMDAVEDRVAGLDAGADDYLVKPFATEELLARLRRLVRRRHGQAEALLRLDDLVVDPAAKTATRGDRPVPITAREFQLLEYLLRRQGAVVTRSELWEHLFDLASDSSSNVLDVLVGRLRRKLREAGGSELIHTRRGLGYIAAIEAGEA